MAESNFELLVDTILVKADFLKKQFIQETVSLIDYVGIFPKDPLEKESMEKILKKMNAVSIYSDKDGKLYLLKEDIMVPHGKMKLIKICNAPSIYNPKGNKLGYVDYQVENYLSLKDRYGNNPAFTFIYGEGWEILSLQNPDDDVSVYIPNIPLSKDLGVS